MDPKILAAWKAIACIILVKRQVLESGRKWRTEIHSYISSLKGTKAQEIQKYIRSHWRIENCCHWVLDTLFREDQNQTGKRNAPKNLSTLRRIALNALTDASDHGKRKRPSSLPKKQLRAAHDEAYLKEVLSLA